MYFIKIGSRTLTAAERIRINKEKRRQKGFNKQRNGESENRRPKMTLDPDINATKTV